MIIVNILVFVFVLGLVILIHEFGHFIMAKRANILCHEFSFGMGPLLWSKKVGETLYAVRAIPIGGYVMMAGEEIEDEIVKEGSEVRLVFDDFENITKIILDHANEKYAEYLKVTVNSVDLKGENNEPLHLNEYTVKRDAFYVFKNREMQIAPHDRSFESKTKSQRFLSIFAGPFMNFVLAFFVFLLINLIVGFPNLDNAELGEIDPDYPAAGKLEKGDIIVSIDGTSVTDWNDVSEAIDQDATDRILTFVVNRDGNEISFNITPILFFYSVGFHSDENSVGVLKIGEISEDTLAGKAGFETGDIILTIDEVAMTSWDDIASIIYDNSTGEMMTFTVDRSGVTKTITIEPYNRDLVESQGLDVIDNFVGITPVYKFNLFRSFGAGIADIKAASSMIFTTINLLFNNDQVSVGDLAGPVGIYDITSRALSAGFLSFLSWIALLSVNLGIINLLPIPALDGGRLVFLGYEVITNRKPNKKVENSLHYVMYILLMGLFIYITFNDLLRLFNLK
jgi:regulator of sigma E protease